MKPTKGEYFRATFSDTPAKVTGWLLGGLGMQKNGYNSFTIHHLWTGFRVVDIECSQRRALEILGMYAALSDWDFVDVEGWKNRDPDLSDKAYALRISLPECAEYNKDQHRRPAINGYQDSERAIASQVATVVRETGIAP